MTRLIRWLLPLLALGALMTAVGHKGRAEGEPDARTDGALTVKDIDKMVYQNLRDIINRGADLYNDGDVSACYRLWEGALLGIRPLLKHRPELQKAIGEGFENAEKDPVQWRRAFVLRKVLDTIRSDIRKNPGEKLPELKRPDDKNVDRIPPPEEEGPVDKKSEDKKGDPKKPDEKKTDPKKGKENPDDDGSGS